MTTPIDATKSRKIAGIITTTPKKFNSQSTTSKWDQKLNIDVILDAAQSSIFHPFIAWMIPLCLVSLSVPTSSSSFRYSVAYAVLLTVVIGLLKLDKSIAGGESREVTFEDELVVVTGGAQGLGLLLVEMFAMKGARVAVLDIREKATDGAEDLGGEEKIKWYKCDVGRWNEVEQCCRKISDDFGSPPTVLINNAAIVHGKSLLDLSVKEIDRSIDVNLSSNFYLIKALLPGMIKAQKGTIVTISSILGKLGCSKLSDYTSTKAALQALHASLTAELSTDPRTSKIIKTILVTPGHLTSPLFSSLSTPSPFFAPIVDTLQLAKKIVAAIENGAGGGRLGGSGLEVAEPAYARWVGGVWEVAPRGVRTWLRRWSGMDGAMERFSNQGKKGH